MLFHSGDLPVAGGVDGEGAGVAVALQGFRGGETKSHWGLVPLTQGLSLCLGGRLGRQRLCLPPHWPGGDGGRCMVLPCFPAQVLVEK